MGAVSSVDGKLSREWRRFNNACSSWRLVDIISARDRFADIYTTHGSFLIGRRQFWEIFTEYEVSLEKEGKFLSIPLAHFGMFEEEEDILDVREVLCLAAILTKGPVASARLEAVFPLFGPQMTEARVLQFFTVLQKAMMHLNVIETRLSPSQLSDLVSKLFGEGGWRKCSTVAAQVISDWALNCPEFNDAVSLLFDPQTKGIVSKTCLLKTQEELKKASSVLKREAKRLISKSNEKKTAKRGKDNKKVKQAGRRASESRRLSASAEPTVNRKDSSPKMAPNNEFSTPYVADFLARIDAEKLQGFFAR